MSTQSDVGYNRRAGYVNGFYGKVGSDGHFNKLTLRIDWDPEIFSHINIITVDKEGYKASYHLKFINPYNWNQNDEYVFDLMQRLTALVTNISIYDAFDRIRSTL